MRGDLLPKIITPIPGPRSRRLARELRQYESRNVISVSNDFPIFWERAAGANVWDVDGNRYIDLAAGFGVASAGHANERVVSAAKAQLQKLPHAMGDVHPVESRLRLAKELSRLTFERWGAGKGKVLFGSSGSDAVELALKTAAIATGKPGVIAFQDGYHGLSYGALDATWSKHYRWKFSEQLGHFTHHVPFPRENVVAGFTPASVGAQSLAADSAADGNSHTTVNVEKEMLTSLRKNQIGAVIVEPIQGRAGIIVPPPDFLPMIRHFCDKHGLMMIADEVYTGFGRTGKWFAVEHDSVVPDLICLGKGMGGGFPISACVGKSEVMDKWPECDGDPIHTSTFFGNPVGCAMALAQIEEIRSKKLVARSWELGKRLRAALSTQHSALSCIGEIRGRGLMLGVELTEKGRARPLGASLVFKIIVRALQRGLIVLADGTNHNVLSLTPPLTITERQLDCAIEIIRDSLRDD